MTKTNRIELTDQEQEQIAEAMPDMLEGIKSENPVAMAWLAHYRARQIKEENPEAEANEVKQEVALEIERNQEQASLAQWCGFPTDMTRCSPFFPMQRNELGNREYLEGLVITSANWGEIKYSGPKLSTYEEDILLALCAALSVPSKNREISDIDGKKTYTYKGKIINLLRVLGYSKPNKKDYERILASLKRLTVNAIELSISSGKTKTGKRRPPRYIYVTNMLSGLKWNDKEKTISATINPYFYETYIGGRVTPMDVAKRLSLKGVISKALYRFIQSQRNGFEGHFLTLADALNMDRNQPAKKTRENIKRAISELVRRGVLEKKSGFIDTDIVILRRIQEPFVPIKKIAVEN